MKKKDGLKSQKDAMTACADTEEGCTEE